MRRKPLMVIKFYYLVSNDGLDRRKNKLICTVYLAAIFGKTMFNRKLISLETIFISCSTYYLGHYSQYVA